MTRALLGPDGRAIRGSHLVEGTGVPSRILRRWMIRLYLLQRLGPKRSLPLTKLSVAPRSRPTTVERTAMFSPGPTNLLLARCRLAVVATVLLTRLARLTDHERPVASSPRAPHHAAVPLLLLTHLQPPRPALPRCWPPRPNRAIRATALLLVYRPILAVASRARDTTPSLQLLSSRQRRRFQPPGPNPRSHPPCRPLWSILGTSRANPQHCAVSGRR